MTGRLFQKLAYQLIYVADTEQQIKLIIESFPVCNRLKSVLNSHSNVENSIYRYIYIYINLSIR